jgi:hypothetical protein
MLAEIDDADDAAFVIVLRRFAFDICGHAHAHLPKSGVILTSLPAPSADE